MTDAQEMNDEVARGPYEIVEALLDGESVNPQALRVALADPAVRDHFVDLLVLREAVGAMVMPKYSAGLRQTSRPSRLSVFATAAAVLVSLALGYLAGHRVEIPAAAQTIEAVVHVQDTPAAPAPTQIITLRPGINWTEKSGEQ
jgi:hypothetical protein